MTVTKKTGYLKAPCPEEKREGLRVASELLNLQTCSCNHDRMVHSQFTGEGHDRKIILNCPCSGRCMVRGCGCGQFAYAERLTSLEGKKRRKQELAGYSVCPPAEKPQPREK